MGAWGTGFWSSDTTSDIRGDYLDRLKRKLTPEEAVAQLVELYDPDEDEGDLFWIAIALLQWDYGHLTEEIKAKALEGLHSGEDELRWAEASPRDRQKRKEVMAQAEEKLLSVKEKPKKVRPYTRKRTKWKVGDVITIRFGGMDSPNKNKRFWPFQNLYGAALVVGFSEQDVGDIYKDPVIAMYEWLGPTAPSMNDLIPSKFLLTDAYSNQGKRYFWIARFPTKYEYMFCGLEIIGHLDVLPFSREELNEEFIDYRSTFGTYAMALADHWLEMGWEIPNASKQETDGGEVE